MSAVTIVECPRDAMQGWKTFISTESKIAYLQKLLGIGFNILDCGSFVSAKAIPQMADTAEVIQHLSLQNTTTKLLVIVANERGAQEAIKFSQIHYLGYPFSISPTFQQRNANSSIEQSWQRVQAIQQLCVQNGKKLVIYISMGFGNPYGDMYNVALVEEWVKKMEGIGISIISLADTVGIATPSEIKTTTTAIITQFPMLEIGVHLHSTPTNWQSKLQAALDAGCRRFDGAIKGIGGCPMVGDDLVGNMNTSLMAAHFKKMGFTMQLNDAQLIEAELMADTVFSA